MASKFSRFVPEATREELHSTPVKWGFGELSRVTFLRTYAWDKADLPNVYGEGATGTETWADCVLRVVDATAQKLQEHGYEESPDHWADMARAMFDFQWFPSGRGLRMMGTPYVSERDGTPLYNCGFVSTFDIDTDPSGAFKWAILASANGVGVGYDTAGRRTLHEPIHSTDPFVVADSREGWAEALGTVFEAYRKGGILPNGLNVRGVRRAGERVKGLGGTASGPRPLVKAWHRLVAIHEQYVGRETDAAYIVDCMGVCMSAILAGGTRRSAMIALGSPTDQQFIDLKTDQRMIYRWRYTSNNSVLDPRAEDLDRVAHALSVFGEPGIIWRDRARKYGRLLDPPDYRDACVIGFNPCGEQGLAHKELCNLAETVPGNCPTIDRFIKVSEYALLFAKTVTLYPLFDRFTQDVMRRNRRVGIGVTGVVQALEKMGEDGLGEWLDLAYRMLRVADQDISYRLKIPTSIKLTTVKPSGTVSLVAGVTPGCHFDHAPFYLRRVRLSVHSPLLAPLKAAGYHVEADQYAEDTMVVSFPVSSGTTVGKGAVPLRRKLEVASFLQHFWSDNLVSCTAEFTADEADQIAPLLHEFQDKLKGISFLRMAEHGYAQPPYETIDAATYRVLSSGLLPVDYGHTAHEADDMFCDGAACEVTF